MIEKWAGTGRWRKHEQKKTKIKIQNHRCERDWVESSRKVDGNQGVKKMEAASVYYELN